MVLFYSKFSIFSTELLIFSLIYKYHLNLNEKQPTIKQNHKYFKSQNLPQVYGITRLNFHMGNQNAYFYFLRDNHNTDVLVSKLFPLFPFLLFLSFLFLLSSPLPTICLFGSSMSESSNRRTNSG